MYVYILANRYRSTVYIGVTNDLVRRVYEHKQGAVEGFTKKYDIKSLVYYEQMDGPEQAIAREKQLKKWNRQWKFELIEKTNPDWKDLYESICS